MSIYQLKLSDYIAAGVPTIATMTLSEFHTAVGIAGGLLGMAYLIWRWRKEAKAK